MSARFVQEDPMTRVSLRTYSHCTLIALSVRPVVLPLPYFLSPLKSRVCSPTSTSHTVLFDFHIPVMAQESECFESLMVLNDG